jgi:hypothetical protein
MYSTRLMKCLAVAVAVLFLTAYAAAQGAATAEMHVAVKDPQGATVSNATVTVLNPATAYERSTSQNVEGEYQFVLLPPGRYTVTVEAPGFAKTVAKNVVITVGQRAEVPITLQLAAVQSVVTVTTEPELIETQRTAPTTTITEISIDNLPINGRNYINFALTDSKLARDTAPSIGAAPTSGLNFGGQRARANLVNVDGADAVDNSTNGIRSTVSQEAVQEFQIITNGYSAEYSRASGGVVNIITKSGSNTFHGNAFGYLRNRKIQAVNPFSNVSDPAYTRVQAGLTAGGPIKKDRTFWFFSYETTRRQETGFSNIGANNFGLVPFDASGLAPLLGGLNFGTVLLDSGLQQPQFVQTLAGTIQGIIANPAIPAASKPALITPLSTLLGSYLTLAGGASGIALNRTLPTPSMVLALVGAGILPASCAASPAACMAVFPETGFPLPPASSFFGLNSIRGNFPLSEGTSIISLRLDHRLTNNQNLMLRASVSPSTVTGIQVGAQGFQTFGQNAWSRTSEQTFRDVSGNVQHSWSIGNNKVNEFRFQYARRGLLYNYSHAPGGSAVGVQIPGYALLGREPFSFVRRTEQRYQFTDNFSLSKGTHTFKWGVDFNYLPLVADFTVNFGGVYNFGVLPASLFLGTSSVNLPLPGFQPIPIPGFSPVQAYGLGFPQNLIQGVGNPHDSFSNKILGVFLQDSWRLRPNLTLNYGVRYDIEFTPTFKPTTAISAAAEQALGIIEGIPRDSNNIAPRIGLAWDPWNNGKTVVRASYGMFYDHPLLALAFDSDVADGSQAATFGLIPGNPGCGTSLATALNAVNTFQGILGTCPGASALNYLQAEQRFNPAPNAPSVFTNQQFLQLGLPMPFLPDGFPVARNFQYAYSQQANFTIERELGSNFALSLEYNFNGGRHLNRPIDSNPIIPSALLANYRNCLADPICAAAPFSARDPRLAGFGGAAPCGVGPAGPWIAGPIMNSFRKGGINPSFVPALQAAGPGGLACLGLADQLQTAYGLGVGVPVPFNAMGANYSNGSSVYHGLSANLRKRFSNHYEFLASYTWSHAIDDSTDLETPLAVQDPFHPSRDRSNSLFDQRHRFVFSGVYQTGKVSGGGFTSKFFSDWTFAPIIEIASGRPFDVLVGSDTNLDGRSQNDRPNAVPAGYVAPCSVPAPVASRFSPTGYLQPACFNDANFGNGTLGRNAGVMPYTVFADLRVARRINLSERVKLDGIMDIFNLPNRFNVAAVNFAWNQAGQRSAAYDPRQFQFALKLNW